jgi:hypothetical protein
MDNKKNIEDALYNIVYRYYKKHKSLPSAGRGMVYKRLLTQHDMIDYTLDKTNELTKISYMYYENYKEEEKYYSSSFYIQ